MSSKTVKRCNCGNRDILFVDPKGVYCERCMPVGRGMVEKYRSASSKKQQIDKQKTTAVKKR
jgi:hypothetical protein